MFAVLDILSLGPHTGYDIKQHMEQSTNYFWNENYGQIYPSLAELLDRKDIAVEVIRQNGKLAYFRRAGMLTGQCRA
ncbi:PadR family transcriptional regulator [Paenibacillus terrae]|uniref:Transcription regulator PadR N-terminal domain-containing protein n=1 Tax=Paenibacillus terrae (strain HPL-003) TaxID=985665 RepID=G7VYC4_PAETH|nr:hypothetical protein HPL003_08445 [Paenibacillus terrae HPL-003]